MCARIVVPQDIEKAAEFDRALAWIREHVDLPQADELWPVRHNAVYTTAVVLWMLIVQRANPDASLEAAVKALLEAPPEFLPRNKRIATNTLSTSSGGYSTARSRLPLSAVEWFAQEVARSLIAAAPAAHGHRRVFLIDGTTLTLAPEPELRRQFPPASNQHGRGVWPIALLTVCHELSSGACLIPQIGAMYGPEAVSETALIEKNLDELPADSIVMADAGFGIFAVAWKAFARGHSFLLRMAPSRFHSLTKQATIVEQSATHTVREHVWTPSSRERKTHPDLPRDAAIRVRLHELVISDQLTLRLVTTLIDDSETLAALYEQRTHVETDLRNLKIVLDTEHIRARSVDTFQKELLASLVFYNLVTQFRAQAARLIHKSPRQMSFKRTWTTFRTFLLKPMFAAPQLCREQFARALSYATLDKLPHRPGRRSPREVYKRRPKSQHFKKRSPKPDNPPDS
jgi:hypothetical protein